MNLFGDSPSSPQSQLAFPVSLTERYRPQSPAEFAGLSKPKQFCAKLASAPFDSGWLFIGPAGTGKTSMGLALARMIPAELHHIPSQSCDLATLERISRTCNYVPMAGYNFHLVLVDEADRMSDAAQLFLLSKLDGTDPCPRTIWIFTANEKTRLHDRFLSRVKEIEFSTYALAADAIKLLERIWLENAPTSPAPNFARIVKESNNNVRECLQKLELELMLAS